MIIVPSEDPESIARAVTILKAGGVIVYPTDTAYGLGADATNSDAIEKIFRIKERSDGKPLPVIVESIEHARQYADLSPKAEILARAYWPGALTLVLSAKDMRLAEAVRGGGTVGMRIPASDWCMKVSAVLTRPIVSTSANTAGTPPTYSIKDARKNLGARGELVDLWIDGGALAEGPISTVVSFVHDLETLREGAISREDIEKMLQWSRFGRGG